MHEGSLWRILLGQCRMSSETGTYGAERPAADRCPLGPDQAPVPASVTPGGFDWHANATSEAQSSIGAATSAAM